jgi:hypothetical protein
MRRQVAVFFSAGGCLLTQAAPHGSFDVTARGDAVVNASFERTFQSLEGFFPSPEFFPHDLAVYSGLRPTRSEQTTFCSNRPVVSSVDSNVPPEARDGSSGSARDASEASGHSFPASGFIGFAPEVTKNTKNHAVFSPNHTKTTKNKTYLWLKQTM